VNNLSASFPTENDDWTANVHADWRCWLRYEKCNRNPKRGRVKSGVSRGNAIPSITHSIHSHGETQPGSARRQRGAPLGRHSLFSHSDAKTK
jgi:hypothetical protein